MILGIQTIQKLVTANLSYDGPPPQMFECSLILHMSILTLQLMHSVVGPSATVGYVKKTMKGKCTFLMGPSENCSAILHNPCFFQMTKGKEFTITKNDIEFDYKHDQGWHSMVKCFNRIFDIIW